MRLAPRGWEWASVRWPWRAAPAALTSLTGPGPYPHFFVGTIFSPPLLVTVTLLSRPET